MECINPLNNGNFPIVILQKGRLCKAKKPYRISAVGHNAGLMAIITPMIDDYHTTFFSGFGVRVILLFSQNIQIFFQTIMENYF